MNSSPLFTLELNRTSSLPLYVQISDEIRQRIFTGRFTPGLKLPSSRNLALEIGVSRTSVVAAYEQLKMEGYLSSKRGSGIQVNPLGNLNLIGSHVRHNKKTETKTDADNQSKQSDPALADTRLFPHRQWARCIARVARTHPHTLVEATGAFGNLDFRQSIAQYLEDWRGINASPEQIIVTAGATDAQELCIKTLLTNQDTVALENPGYLPLRHYVKQLGIKTIWMPIDSHGAQLPKHNSAQVVVVTPSHQYPLGGTMSPARRLEFIQWSQDTNGWIIEDDYDSEFRYAGNPIPALSSLDHLNRSIYIGSFAKIFTTGLRLGFLVIPKSLISTFQEKLRQSPSKASVAMQRPLSDFMNNGEFYRHIRRARRIYGERREQLIHGLRTILKDLVTFDDFQAGMQIAVRLSESIDDHSLSVNVNKRGANVLPLTPYYHGKHKTQGLLMGFCAYQPDEIEQCLNVVKDEIHALRRKHKI